MYLAILSLVFILTVAISFYVAQKMMDHHLDDRLLQIRAQTHRDQDEWIEHPVMAALERFFAPLIKWSMPKEDWESSTDRVQFLNAGLRSKFSVIVFLVAKHYSPFYCRGCF